MNWLPDLRMHIEITDRCNLRCRHCFKRRESHDLPLELVRRLLVDARRLNVRRVTFGGGEPTLHPDFATMLREAVQAQYTVGMVSNARGFRTTWEWLRDLPRGEGGVGAVSFSLDGPTAEIHDAIRSQGSFSDVMKALTLCRIAGVRATTKTVVNRLNMEHLEAIVRLVSGMGASAAEFAGMLPTEHGVTSGLQPSPKDLARAADALDRLAGLYRAEVLRDISLGHEPFMVCCDPFRGLSFSVDVHGRLSLCCMLSVLSDAGDNQSDVIADLYEESLVDAAPRFLARARAMLNGRAKLLERREPKPLERFPCTLCAAQLGKLDWLARHPESEWTDVVGAFRA